MRKDLTTIENTEVALSRTKSFMGTIGNIFNNKITVKDDGWMQRLWDWADDNNIPDYGWDSDQILMEGLPRSKEGLLNLTKLVINNMKIKVLPNEIGELTSLTGLYMAGNRLLEIPDEIGNLAQLTELVINRNHLTKLPKKIENLTNLTYLSLEENQFTELPKEIGYLTNLTELFLRNNSISELHTGIGSLVKLDNLILDHNKLKNLPEEIGNLAILTGLHIDDNQISELPKEIGKLTELKWLTLSNNKLTKLPEEIGELHLAKLELGNNYLTVLPNKIVNLAHIRINMYGNDIHLTYEQKDWLTNLILYHSGVGLDDNVYEREILGNSKTESRESDNYNWMQRLWNWADENDISDYEWIADDRLEKGGYYNGFPRDKDDLLHISELSLSELELDYIPSEFGNIESLKEFDLGDNRLCEIPNAIGNLSNLIELDLYDNIIKNLPDEICGLVNLRVLNLSNNPLTFTEKQRIWINGLIKDGCEVYFDGDVWEESDTEASIYVENNDNGSDYPIFGRQESYENFNQRELDNMAKTVAFLFQISNSVQTERIVESWTDEEIIIANNKYDQLDQSLSEATTYSEFISIVDIDIETYEEIDTYKKWFLNSYYPKSLEIRNKARQRKNDEIDKLSDKFLYLFAETLKRLKE